MIKKSVEFIRQIVGKFVEIILMRLVLLIFWCAEVAETTWYKAKAINDRIKIFIHRHDAKFMWAVVLGFLVFCFFLIP